MVSSAVVTASRAVLPIAMFRSAVLVVLEGSLPRYIELFSTKASERSFIADAPPPPTAIPEATSNARLPELIA